MNKHTRRALLTGKRPRSSLKGVRGGAKVIDLGVPGHLLRKT